MTKNKFYVLILILTFIACGKRTDNVESIKSETIEKREISEEELTEINLIIEAIIIQKNLDVLKQNKSSEDLIIENLIKIPIDLEENYLEEIKLPPIPGHIYISQLINKKYDNKSFFSSEDSLYIMQQTTFSDSIKIAAYILEKVNTKENLKDKLKNNSDLYFGEYKISLPILSKDKQTAYVKLSYRCGALCGHGETIILKKIDNKWTIVEDFDTWIS